MNVARNALWRAEHGLPSNWRYRKVRMRADEWLAKQRAKREAAPEFDGQP